MRQPRLKLDAQSGSAYYHCVSRVVDQRPAFGPEDKDQFIVWMQSYAEFCGVHILTYCVMPNYFSLLIEVPAPPKVLPTVDESLRLSGLVLDPARMERLQEEMPDWSAEKLADWQTRLHEMMWDVSAYMKVVKQRFTQWYNREHQRRGTLWEQRFKSVLVEGTTEALARMAAYIDLNPVRAHLVEDPKDYRWSGFAAAEAGRRLAREGIRRVIHPVDPRAVTIADALTQYRLWIYGEGLPAVQSSPAAASTGAGLAPEQVQEVLKKNGKLGWHDFARCHVRYFSDGAVIGSRQWVDTIFETNRKRFGPKRKDGARKMKYLADSPIFGLRDLRVNPVAASQTTHAQNGPPKPGKAP